MRARPGPKTRTLLGSNLGFASGGSAKTSNGGREPSSTYSSHGPGNCRVQSRSFPATAIPRCFGRTVKVCSDCWRWRVSRLGFVQVNAAIFTARFFVALARNQAGASSGQALVRFSTQTGTPSTSAVKLGEQAFLAEFLRVERLLAAHLRSATGDVHAAEDLLQAAASILWEKRAEYDVSRPFAAWALGVAQLEVLKWRQRVARSREVLSEDAMRLLSETAARQAGEVDQRYYFLADCLQSLG